MGKIKWQIILGVVLLCLSALFYYVHYLIYHDLHHIFFYMLSEIAFVFIEVLLVTIVIHKILSVREKNERLEKLGMVMGVFYSEMGSKLTSLLSTFNPAADDICDELVVDDMWRDKEFRTALKSIDKFKAKVDLTPEGLEQLRKFLLEKRTFLLQLLQNPILFEHEDFAGILWGIFYITEELEHRKEGDRRFFADVERVYRLLVKQWLLYMKHLRRERSSLFSLALRSNPFTIHCEEE